MNKREDRACNESTAAYERWMQQHRKQAKGERLRRLNENSNHAEKMFATLVWWTAFGNFDKLHPEYEIRDYRDGWRFLDFAFLGMSIKVCIEIDGFGPHWRNVNRRDFGDQLMRQNHLVIDGWIVLRFSYDDVMEKPRQCQQVLQQLIGKWSSKQSAHAEAKLLPVERVLLRLASGLSKPLTPQQASEELGLHRTTIVRHFRSLAEKGYMMPTNPSAKRIASYRILRDKVPYGGW